MYGLIVKYTNMDAQQLIVKSKNKLSQLSTRTKKIRSNASETTVPAGWTADNNEKHSDSGKALDGAILP